jgi:hypothetical protein
MQGHIIRSNQLTEVFTWNDIDPNELHSHTAIGQHQFEVCSLEHVDERLRQFGYTT